MSFTSPQLQRAAWKAESEAYRRGEAVPGSSAGHFAVSGGSQEAGLQVSWDLTAPDLIPGCQSFPLTYRDVFCPALWVGPLEAPTQS